MILSLNKILELLPTFQICIGLVYTETKTEIKTEIWISFPSFIRIVKIFPIQKYSTIVLFLCV